MPARPRREMWRADHICADRGAGRRKEYLVKYFGYPTSAAKWEPATSCSAELLRDYESYCPRKDDEEAQKVEFCLKCCWPNIPQ